MDCSTLPLLVFDEIFRYLSVKDRIRCKAVCSNWKKQVERKDKSRERLIFHIGYYPLNGKWCWANNKGLMKFENSFQIKCFSFLVHPFTKQYFKNLKQVHLSNSYSVHNKAFYQQFHLCIAWLVNCEVLEIYGVCLGGSSVFDLPKLKVLALKDTNAEHLVIDCRLLEVLILCGRYQLVDYKRTNRLRRLECLNQGALGWATSVKFANLDCLSLFNGLSEPVRADLFEHMLKLKKFVYYSAHSRPELKAFREQKKRLGLNNLKILAAGFEDEDANIIMTENQASFTLNMFNIDYVFENYAKLTEPCAFDVCYHYNHVFERFRLLPANFLAKFPVNALVVVEATSDPHLFGFLKHCPALFSLRVSFSKTRPLVLDQLFVLTPSLRELCLNEECGLPIASLDLSFLRNLKLNFLSFVTEGLPIKSIADAFKCSQFLRCFNLITGDFYPEYQLSIYMMSSIHALESEKVFGVVHDGNERDLAKFGRLGPLVKHLKSHHVAQHYLI